MSDRDPLAKPSLLGRMGSAVATACTRWLSDDGWLLSAAMAYYGAFALFPLCLIMIAVLSWLSRLSPALRVQRLEWLDMVEQNAGPWVGEQLRNLLRGVDTQAGVSGPVGVLTLLIAAIGIFIQLES
ncbi:MAG TPA: YhjD/YihY/BrkB family envelope integrity protein, partial [Pirellulales bacterium]|nr:YhjD/YihY/BrkB family envelope integrity protein [Pirellulales bacterium]